jgi:hypothetical protein
VHPFCSSLGCVACFFLSFWSPSAWHVWCGNLKHIFIISLVVSFFSPYGESIG